MNLLKQTVICFKEIPILKLLKKLHDSFQSNSDAPCCIAKGLVLRVVKFHRGGSVTNKATLLVFVINDYLFKPGNTGKAVVLSLQKVISFVSLIKEPLALTWSGGTLLRPIGCATILSLFRARKKQGTL